MAAVLALILLPLVIALGSVVSITGGGLEDLITALTVVAIGGGGFYGLMHFIHTLEGPEADKHAKRA
ncbi:MAG TPA: hypothetical protein VL463_33065 [Kofleriaceae bacterium]|nr:hypothetical protein [Kofleriaceae bacterium]